MVPRALGFAMNPATLEKRYMQSSANSRAKKLVAEECATIIDFPIEIPCASKKKRASHSPPFFTFPQ